VADFDSKRSSQKEQGFTIRDRRIDKVPSLDRRFTCRRFDKAQDSSNF
jgi:hypothetical protein